MTPAPLTPYCSGKRDQGFTLAEMAIVLLILGLLASSLLPPLSARMNERGRQTTAARLQDIEHALIGFAILHGRLPCPSTEADPASAHYGLEQTPPCNHAQPGFLPWRTLGLTAVDAWGQPRSNVSDSWDGHWRYRPDPGLSDSTITAASATQSNIQIRDHAGNAITTLSASRAAAVVFSMGANRQPDGLNATHSPNVPTFQAGETTPVFDDQVLWIGLPLLISRLAQAGRL